MRKNEEMEEKLDKLTDNKPVQIPFAVLENAMARAERREKRHFITVVILLCSIIVSNVCWASYNINKGELSPIVIEDIKRADET